MCSPSINTIQKELPFNYRGQYTQEPNFCESPTKPTYQQAAIHTFVTAKNNVYNYHMNFSNNQHHLLGTTLNDFTVFCAEHDLPKYRAKQVFEWVYTKGVSNFVEMSNLSKPLREMLAEHWVINTGKEIRRQQASDGTIKLLLEWPDSVTSECVLISEDRRRTACISSQVGCPVGCQFCASGLGGLQRNLTAGEMVEQAMSIRRLCEPIHRLNNIVLMGLGEPLTN
ncbi:MAG: hypothetical protein JSV03_03405 [Planctomycetota bacterium]|nr:MAG: hypothetical protein JSV03_03405 [Planctomycetota bacterium]